MNVFNVATFLGNPIQSHTYHFGDGLYHPFVVICRWFIIRFTTLLICVSIFPGRSTTLWTWKCQWFKDCYFAASYKIENSTSSPRLYHGKRQERVSSRKNLRGLFATWPWTDWTWGWNPCWFIVLRRSTIDNYDNMPSARACFALFCSVFLISSKL